jgi:HAD superfamily hydrolase (TIGR01509 family)
MSGALQAIVFDFDGVIANSEPLHLRAFQRALADHGVALSAADYYSRYLGYDDIGVFTTVARDRGVALTEGQVHLLVEKKGEYLQQSLEAGDVLFPGAAGFIRQAASVVPIAIASGAQRHEIEEILDATGLRDLFMVIVAAGDTAQGKPSPEPYARAFELLERASSGLLRDRCVAIEDSRWGIESARAAGLRCVGVTTSYAASELPGAEIVANGLNALTLPMLNELVARGPDHLRRGSGGQQAGHYERARA